MIKKKKKREKNWFNRDGSLSEIFFFPFNFRDLMRHLNKNISSFFIFLPVYFSQLFVSLFLSTRETDFLLALCIIHSLKVSPNPLTLLVGIFNTMSCPKVPPLDNLSLRTSKQTIWNCHSYYWLVMGKVMALFHIKKLSLSKDKDRNSLPLIFLRPLHCFTLEIFPHPSIPLITCA